MYHVELRQFPHNFCRFNLTEQELQAMVLDAWAQGEWIELGERQWNPHQAHLKVLEGPQLPVEQLSMGRGWRNAARQGQDVTERLLATARAASKATAGAGAGTASASSVAGAEESLASIARSTDSDPSTHADAPLDLRLAADSLGLEALARLGEQPEPLAIVWQLARERYPKRSASDCLKLAEYAVRSLAESRLAVVLVVRDTDDVESCTPGEQVERALHGIVSWSNTGGSSSALIRKA
ncbi:MAG: hypothetical protein WAN93_14245 [Solirubrobacteraceae bacterium]